MHTESTNDMLILKALEEGGGIKPRVERSETLGIRTYNKDRTHEMGDGINRLQLMPSRNPDYLSSTFITLP